MFGIAYDFIKSGKRARLRIVMERVNCDGDMHDEIHAEDHWACLRDNGVDTGVSVRSSYWTPDGTDVWAYLMPIELKLRLALDLARSMRELERASVVHRALTVRTCTACIRTHSPHAFTACIHSYGVTLLLVRDLKPSNLLVNKNCDLKAPSIA